jgi:hypothetical protein
MTTEVVTSLGEFFGYGLAMFLVGGFVGAVVLAACWCWVAGSDEE